MSTTSQPTTGTNFPVQQSYPHPCPSCGHCPTCGRNSRHPAPYWPYPYQPYVWHGTSSPNQYVPVMVASD